MASTTSMQRLDHLDLTAREARLPGVFPAHILSIKDATPTVRLLRLQIAAEAPAVPAPVADLEASPGASGADARGFTYTAGQWVDFYIPGVDVVGGFSFVSCPGLPPAVAEVAHAPPGGDVFDLAVKRSRHPPAAWVHERAREGDRVHVRVGGSFTLPACGVISNTEASEPGARRVGQATPCDHVLLVAGGVGINPLYAMMLQLCRGDVHGVRRVTLVHSVKDSQELLFADRVCALARWARLHPDSAPSIHAIYAVTKPDDPCDGPLVANVRATFGTDSVKRSRVRPAEVARMLATIGNTKGTRAFVCGPPAMTDMFVSSLPSELGISSECVCSERWW